MFASLSRWRIISSNKPENAGDSEEALRLKGGSSGYDVFVSFVAAEAEDEAAELQLALEAHGKQTFVAPDTAEMEELDELIDALDASKLVVILGTNSYGSGGTQAQLAFISQESKPCLLVKLTDRFEIAKARYTLDSEVPAEIWKPGTSVPANVVDRIVNTLKESNDKNLVPVDGFGEYLYPNGVKYIGVWKDGQPDGLGRQEYTDGSIFEGRFRSGFRQGLGRYTYGPNSSAPGDYYEGNYLRGKRDGQGKYVYSPTGKNAGDMYIGGWRKGTRQGFGTYTYASGDIFNGQWIKGVKQGQGVYTYAGESKGDVYKGEYRNDVREGKGEYRYKNGDYYSGGWAQNNKNGHGVFLFDTSGNRYDGDWKDGYMEGYGEFFWGPGSGFHGAHFKGYWKKGKREGKGVFVAVTGEERDGVWKDGKLSTQTHSA